MPRNQDPGQPVRFPHLLDMIIVLAFMLMYPWLRSVIFSDINHFHSEVHDFDIKVSDPAINASHIAAIDVAITQAAADDYHQPRIQKMVQQADYWMVARPNVTEDNRPKGLTPALVGVFARKSTDNPWGLAVYLFGVEQVAHALPNVAEMLRHEAVHFNYYLKTLTAHAAHDCRLLLDKPADPARKGAQHPVGLFRTIRPLPIPYYPATAENRAAFIEALSAGMYRVFDVYKKIKDSGGFAPQLEKLTVMAKDYKTTKQVIVPTKVLPALKQVRGRTYWQTHVVNQPGFMLHDSSQPQFPLLSEVVGVKQYGSDAIIEYRYSANPLEAQLIDIMLAERGATAEVYGDDLNNLATETHAYLAQTMSAAILQELFRS